MVAESRRLFPAWLHNVSARTNSIRAGVAQSATVEWGKWLTSQPQSFIKVWPSNIVLRVNVNNELIKWDTPTVTVFFLNCGHVEWSPAKQRISLICPSTCRIREVFNSVFVVGFPLMNSLQCYTLWNVNFRYIHLVFLFAVRREEVGSKKWDIGTCRIIILHNCFKKVFHVQRWWAFVWLNFQ